MAIYRFTVRGQCLSQEWRNVWYGENSVDNVDQLQDVVDQLRIVYVTLGVGLLHSGWNTYGVDARDMDVAGSPSFGYSYTSGTLTGDQALAPVANQTAALVGYTALTVKPNRVRKYLAGFTTVSLGSDGKWSGAAQTGLAAFNTAVLAVTTAVPDTTFPHSVTIGPLGTATADNRCTVAYLRAVPATQRRRRLGVGI